MRLIGTARRAQTSSCQVFCVNISEYAENSRASFKRNAFIEPPMLNARFPLPSSAREFSAGQARRHHLNRRFRARLAYDSKAARQQQRTQPIGLQPIPPPAIDGSTTPIDVDQPAVGCLRHGPAARNSGYTGDLSASAQRRALPRLQQFCCHNILALDVMIEDLPRRLAHELANLNPVRKPATCSGGRRRGRRKGRRIRPRTP